MGDLTATDVDEIKRFLMRATDEIRTWLPAPLEPAWKSEASSELRNPEQGPSGPWGETPVRMAYAAIHHFLFAATECLEALADSMSLETTIYVPHVLARAAMEAGAQAWWLLEPGIGARRRVIRSVLIRKASARYLGRAANEMSPPVNASAYGEDEAMVDTHAQGLGLALVDTRVGRNRVLTCETETLPGYTQRANDFQKAVYMTAAYSIYSGAAHAELYAISQSWRQSTSAPALLERSHERVAIWAAVYAASGFAMVPAFNLRYSAMRADCGADAL